MVRDLNSKYDTTPVLSASFIPPQQHDGRLLYFDVMNNYECYKHFLELVQGDLDIDEESTHKGDAIAAPVPTNSHYIGQLRVIWYAAFEITDERRPVVVIALDVPAYKTYWFWTTRDASPVIKALLSDGIITPYADYSKIVVGSAAHGPLYMMIWATFDQVVNIPDSDEYKRAMIVSSADELIPRAPPNALVALQSWAYLRNRPVLRSLADDRYAEHLQDWEIYIAERADLCAAEYLEVRRLYFARFHADVTKHRLDNGLEDEEQLPALRDWKNKVDFLTAIRPWNWGRRRTFAQSFDHLGMLDENLFH